MIKTISKITALGMFTAAMAAPAVANASTCDLFDLDCWLGGGHGGGNNNDGTPLLKGTKCWSFQAAFGKPAFITLHFKKVRKGHSLFSGQVVRADGGAIKPDRVLQVSGSAGYHTFVGDNDTDVERFLLDLHYSFSKTGTDPAAAFTESGFHLRGHYSVRVDPESLDGVFAGNDFILRWAPPLNGPRATFSRDVTAVGGDGVSANYLGGIDCAGRTCGDILPINNAGTWTLVGRNARQCERRNPQNQE